MNHPTRAKRFDFYDVAVLQWILTILGVVLIVGGTLKIHAFTTAYQEDDLWTLMDALLSEAEILFGLWLASARDPLRTRPWAIAFLAGLWAATLYRGVEGSCSCGRFGIVPVSPWILTVLDLVAIGSLLKWGWFQGNRSEPPPTHLGAPAMILVGLVVAAAGIGRPLLVSKSGTAVRRGNPLADASLTFRSQSIRLEVRTDGRGAFRLPPVRPGRYAVSVAADAAHPKLESNKPRQGDGNVSGRPSRKPSSKALRPSEYSGRHEGVESLPLEIAECADSLRIEF